MNKYRLILKIMNKTKSISKTLNKPIKMNARKKV